MIWDTRTLFASFVYFLVLFFTNDASGEEVLLQRAFRDGSRFTTISETKLSQSLGVADQEIKATSSQTMTMLTEVGRRDSDGKVRVQRTIQGMTTKISLPGEESGELELNSANPVTPEGSPLAPLANIFKAMHGATWTELRDKSNRVISVDGSLKALEGASLESQNAIREQLNPEILKEAANREMQKLPGKNVGIGDQWNVMASYNLGAGQKMTFDTTYQYNGPATIEQRTLDTVKLTHGNVEWTIDPKGGLPLKLVRSELKVVMSEGQVLFDRQLGEIVRTSERIHVQGNVVLDAGGQELPGLLTVRIESQIVSK